MISNLTYLLSENVKILIKLCFMFNVMISGCKVEDLQPIQLFEGPGRNAHCALNIADPTDSMY